MLNEICMETHTNRNEEHTKVKKKRKEIKPKFIIFLMLLE